MKKIAIFGTGGNCVDILDAIAEINAASGERVYDCLGFFDDDPAKQGKTFLGAPVIGPLSMAKEFTDCAFVFGIGSVSNYWKRHEILARIGIEDERYETIVHPTASVSRSASLGHGTVVLQHVTIATNVSIGKHVYILPNSVISHNAVISDFTCITGGVCISGNVRVGHNCYLGTNSAIKGGLSIGNYALLGMGSVALEDVPDDSVFVGNPARFLRRARPDAPAGNL